MGNTVISRMANMNASRRKPLKTFSIGKTQGELYHFGAIRQRRIAS